MRRDELTYQLTPEMWGRAVVLWAKPLRRRAGAVRATFCADLATWMEAAR